ncbi:hypothetical protein [Streptomyces sp. NPDC057910]|uniref:hypothetical protein n=1 Tax=Streptomyces sp. NPDC057910 TaxID=3346278 RepID=UPI0036F06566
MDSRDGGVFTAIPDAWPQSGDVRVHRSLLELATIGRGLMDVQSWESTVTGEAFRAFCMTYAESVLACPAYSGSDRDPVPQILADFLKNAPIGEVPEYLCKTLGVTAEEYEEFFEEFINSFEGWISLCLQNETEADVASDGWRASYAFHAQRGESGSPEGFAAGDEGQSETGAEEGWREAGEVGWDEAGAGYPDVAEEEGEDDMEYTLGELDDFSPNLDFISRVNEEYLTGRPSEKVEWMIIGNGFFLRPGGLFDHYGAELSYRLSRMIPYQEVRIGGSVTYHPGGFMASNRVSVSLTSGAGHISLERVEYVVSDSVGPFCKTVNVRY